MESVELDRLIERRASREPDPDQLEPSYAESVRRYNTGRREANRAEWAAYHAEQAERLRRNLAALISHHEARAAALNPHPLVQGTRPVAGFAAGTGGGAG
jgi:hypothetical protein